MEPGKGLAGQTKGREGSVVVSQAETKVAGIEGYFSKCDRVLVDHQGYHTVPQLPWSWLSDQLRNCSPHISECTHM